jgi:hypothetical protein
VRGLVVECWRVGVFDPDQVVAYSLGLLVVAMAAWLLAR